MSTARQGWVAGALLRRLARRFREEWRRLPHAARRRWTATIASGFVVLVAAALGLLWAVRRLAASGALDWEAGALRTLERRLPFSFSTGVWFQALGTDFMLATLAATTAGIAAWARKPLPAATILAALALLDPVIRLAWMLWPRPRPAVVFDGAAAPDFASFPSGHTAKSVALYGLLTYLWGRSSSRAAERATATLAATACVALVIAGRLRMGVHWPSDIAAGALLGALWLTTLAAALRGAERAAAESENRGRDD